MANGAGRRSITGWRWLVPVAALSLLIGCGPGWRNFSQHPGFAAYYAAHPRGAESASPEQQRLLRRFKPRLWVAAGAEGPLSFYDDYIAEGQLRDAEGRLVSDAVNRTILNRVGDRTDVVFVHRPQPGPVTPVAFARIDRAWHPALGELQFLTYHFVFRHSGLVTGLPWWQAWPLRLLGDPEDWHQLDHYTAATVVLDGAQHPLALLLQQHNQQRSYRFGADLVPPADGHPALVAARRSNELYPYQPGVGHHRVVRFLGAKTLPYLVTGEDRPWLAGEDVTEAGREVAYRLGFLPADDAFYRFAGYLGERRWLAGRDGPPGADFNTLPAFKAPLVALVAFNWHEGDRVQMAALRDFLAAPDPDGPAFAELLRLFLAKGPAPVGLATDGSAPGGQRSPEQALMSEPARRKAE